MDDCCHACNALDSNEVFKKGRNERCEAGSWPNKEQTACHRINTKEESIPNYDKTCSAVITVDILSTLFILIILAFSVLFLLKRNNPIVFKTGLIHLEGSYTTSLL